MDKFELGPVQEGWLDSMEKHPERQARDDLGSGTPDDYGACCLGEYLIVACAMNGLPAPFDCNEINDCLVQGEGSSVGQLENSYEDLGLLSAEGNLKSRAEINGNFYGCLVEMNDGYDPNDGGHFCPPLTWPQIAAYIRSNPENVFVKSV